MTTATKMSKEEILATSVDALYLRIRAFGTLRSRGIKTVGNLVDTDARELLASQGCGPKTVAEIVACVQMLGLKMVNSDGLFPDSVIQEYITAKRESLADKSTPKPHVETFHEKQSQEIKRKQLMVMLMRVNGAPFKVIAKELGRTEGTARVYFTKFGRSLVREAEKRKVSVADVLTEKNIPLAAIELMRKDGAIIGR
jgi:DNA-binding NarL/FixJ family response regulator